MQVRTQSTIIVFALHVNSVFAAKHAGHLLMKTVEGAELFMLVQKIHHQLAHG